MNKTMMAILGGALMILLFEFTTDKRVKAVDKFPEDTYQQPDGTVYVYLQSK